MEALEPILDIVMNILVEPAFNKSRKLINRLPYLITYLLIAIFLISLIFYLGYLLLIDNNLWGIGLMSIDLILIFVFIYPFFYYK